MDIENKIKQTSIRGRFTFGVCCIEQYTSEKNIENKWITKLFNVLWKFTETNRIDIWQEKISFLTPLNILDKHPDNLYSDYPDLTEVEFKELKEYYAKLDKEFISLIDETIEVALGNLYTCLLYTSPSPRDA